MNPLSPVFSSVESICARAGLSHSLVGQSFLTDIERFERDNTSSLDKSYFPYIDGRVPYRFRAEIWGLIALTNEAYYLKYISKKIKATHLRFARAHMKHFRKETAKLFTPEERLRMPPPPAEWF